MKIYRHTGRAGCVSLRKSQLFGVTVGVYRADQANLDDLDGEAPWVTICEDHGTLCNHETLKEARAHAPWLNWCEDCQETR